MQEPMMYEASELKYETNITFPRIVIDKYKYQDIEMTVYKIQHFYDGCFYEKTTYDRDEAIKELGKLNNKYKLK